MFKKWHSLYLVYIHQYFSTKNTNGATINFHKNADAAIIQQPPSQYSMSSKHCNSVQSFRPPKISSRKSVLTAPTNPQHTTQQAVFSDGTALQDRKQDQLNPCKPVKKWDGHQDESFSPASSLYLESGVWWVWRDQPAGGERAVSTQLLNILFTSVSIRGSHQESFHPGAGDPTFLEAGG